MKATAGNRTDKLSTLMDLSKGERQIINLGTRKSRGKVEWRKIK